MTMGEAQTASPSQLIDARIEELGDWRGEMLARLRKLVGRGNHVGVDASRCDGAGHVSRRDGVGQGGAGGGCDRVAVRRDQDRLVPRAASIRLVKDLQRTAHVEQRHPVVHEEGDAVCPNLWLSWQFGHGSSVARFARLDP